MQGKKHILSSIPSVDELLKNESIEALINIYPRSIVVEGIRAYLDEFRKLVLALKEEEIVSFDFSENRLVKGIVQRIEYLMRSKLIHVVNATGVVLHTNLGRALLSPKLKDKLWEIAFHYSNLEMDVETGERGSRYSHVEELICKLTGAEAAFVVNNNAAAVMLVLSALAKDREVIVSRGQLVEIGGSFRVPDVMAQSGAKLTEVGTTNKTHLKDYQNAINENTAALMKVHTSNYRICGFTEEVASEDMVALGQKAGLPVIEDLGSGVLLDLSLYGLPYEPTVQSAVKSGMDIVTFSGDKMLGGPQAGIIIGKRTLVEQMKKHPLTRAFRIDKLTLAALEGTLRLYLDEEAALSEIPVLRMLTLSPAALNEKAEKLYACLDKLAGQLCHISIEDDFSEVGGGSMPLHKMPTKVIAIQLKGFSIDRLSECLRAFEVPVIARINKDKLLLDIRTILENEFEIIEKALEEALKTTCCELPREGVK